MIIAAASVFDSDSLVLDSLVLDSLVLDSLVLDSLILDSEALSPALWILFILASPTLSAEESLL